MDKGGLLEKGHTDRAIHKNTHFLVTARVREIIRDENLPSFSLILMGFFMSQRPVLNYRGPSFRGLNLNISSFFEIGHFHSLMKMI